jgi:hypothetical protein
MTAIVTCPECDKKFKTRDDARGKRVRCPACAAIFVVEELKIDEGGRAPAPQPAPAPVPTAAAPPKPAAFKSPFDDEEEEENSNPYGVGTIDLRPRCPSCANEMESEDAVICLFCGYNTQTRRAAETKKVLAHTGVDRAAWLTPGILCAAGIFLVIIGNVSFVFGLPAATDHATSGFWSWFTNEPSKLWSTLLQLLAIWWMGQFAYKRLLIEPTPPEQELD